MWRSKLISVFILFKCQVKKSKIKPKKKKINETKLINSSEFASNSKDKKPTKSFFV